MQGQQLDTLLRIDFLGFIPADAGATSPGTASHAGPGVHPCGCRGNGNSYSTARTGRGSSLRMQGQRMRPNVVRKGKGFIPADAGATMARRRTWPGNGVHPCGCRGNSVISPAGIKPEGSSLRMQGQRGRSRCRAATEGFIPADAGATWPNWRRRYRSWVHPCGCRGNFGCVRAVAQERGSSLRMQGQHDQSGHNRCAGGFIPADAGQPEYPYRLRPGPGFIPADAGQPRDLAQSGSGGGFIPADAGQPVDRAAMGDLVGFIPADAGQLTVAGQTATVWGFIPADAGQQD